MTGIDAAVAADEGVFLPRGKPEPFVALQRVVVRMLFDPAFARRVYDEPHEALAGLELPPRGVADLLRNDRRLWNADPLRRTRALRILMEEFKVSSTLSLLETRRLAFLDGFFSTPEFHDAVRDRGYLALAYARFLERGLAERQLVRPATAAVVHLETALARCRRAWREARRHPRRRVDGREGSTLRVKPGVGTISVPKGTLALVQHVERWLFETSLVPALALCDDAKTPDPLPILDPLARETYLLRPDERGQVTLHEVPAAYHVFLVAVGDGGPFDAIHEALRERGIRDEDVHAMQASLLELGLLGAPAGHG